jgi:hypothetical protein
MGLVFLQLPLQPPCAVRQVDLQVSGSRLPPSVATQLESCDLLGHLVPSRARQLGQWGQTACPQKMLMNPGGGTDRVPLKVVVDRHCSPPK